MANNPILAGDIKDYLMLLREKVSMMCSFDMLINPEIQSFLNDFSIDGFMSKQYTRIGPKKTLFKNFGKYYKLL